MRFWQSTKAHLRSTQAHVGSTQAHLPRPRHIWGRRRHVWVRRRQILALRRHIWAWLWFLYDFKFFFAPLEGNFGQAEPKDSTKIPRFWGGASAQGFGSVSALFRFGFGKYFAEVSVSVRFGKKPFRSNTTSRVLYVHFAGNSILANPHRGYI